MRILYLSQLVPYPIDAGPKMRIYYVLRHLAEAGHEVTLLAFRRETDTEAHIEHLRSFCAAVDTVPMVRSRARDLIHAGRSLLTGQPFLIARDTFPAMQARVRQLVTTERFDAIHADQLWMAPYALAARETALGSPRLSLDQHNAVHLIPQRLADSSRGRIPALFLQREAQVMKEFERMSCRRFDDVIWVTAEDQVAVGIDGALPAPRSHVIPICVDPENTPVVRRVPNPHRITFLGGLHWPPNAAGVNWFMREVWPMVKDTCPDAVLTVIGKSPSGGWVYDTMSTTDRVEITGYVTDLTSYLAETAVFIVPLLAGGGMRVKILDAWSWALPVVSTSIGAEGIIGRHGIEFLIADQPDEFAAAIHAVWRDPQLGVQLGSSGRELVEGNYNWRSVYRKWDSVFPPPLAHVIDPQTPKVMDPTGESLLSLQPEA